MYKVNYCQTPVTEKTQIRSARLNAEVKEQSLVIEFAFPGFSKDQISIDVEDRYLIVKTKTSEENGQEKQRFLYREFRPQAQMSRKVFIPEAYDLGNVKAQMQQGVLRMEIAKHVKNTKSIEIL